MDEHGKLGRTVSVKVLVLSVLSVTPATRERWVARLGVGVRQFRPR